MSFTLAESPREYIGSYGNTSEHLRDLIRPDHNEQAERLRDLIGDGLAAGEGRVATDNALAVLRTHARGADA